MRTTITFEPDVAAAIEHAQRDSGAGVSAVVNELVRRGVSAPPAREPFVLRSRPLGLRVDVSDVQGALDALDGADRRC